MLLLSLTTCKQDNVVNGDNKEMKTGAAWQQQFNEQLPLLGHRNWVLIVDKAFPLQTASGISYINSNEKLLPVLQYVLQQTNNATHIKPVIYRDKELAFITEGQVAGVTTLRRQYEEIFKGQPVQTILHNSVFSKLEQASRLFKVVVIKTDETIPYSSIFLQLDCKYWDSDKENELRSNMKGK